MGSALVGLRAGLIGSMRRTLPRALVRSWALPVGATWDAPASLALPPSPGARYMYPSGPKARVPPLWLLALWAIVMTSRRVAGSTRFGLVADILNSLTTRLKLWVAVGTGSGKVGLG